MKTVLEKMRLLQFIRGINIKSTIFFPFAEFSFSFVLVRSVVFDLDLVYICRHSDELSACDIIIMNKLQFRMRKNNDFFMSWDLSGS